MQDVGHSSLLLGLACTPPEVHVGMAKRGGKKDVDAEVDFHGMTAEQFRQALDRHLHGWKGLGRVRVVHGQGTSLLPTLHEWCRERAIEFHLEPHNPGSTILFPNRRPQTVETPLNTVSEKMPEALKQMRFAPPDPETLKRQAEEQRRQQLVRKELEKRHKEQAAEVERKRRQDALLWEAEKARLDAVDKHRSQKKWEDTKPGAPRVVTRSIHTKMQEGYWRSELVRVADTDTDTLKKEKLTGLDKLAPPMEAVDPNAKQKQEPQKPAAPKRDVNADNALFEEEMARLMEAEHDRRRD